MKFITLIAVTFALIAPVTAKADGFDRYMAKIERVAKKRGLTVDITEEATREYFWLYCYVNDPRHPMSPNRAVNMALAMGERQWREGHPPYNASTELQAFCYYEAATWIDRYRLYDPAEEQAEIDYIEKRARIKFWRASRQDIKATAKQQFQRAKFETKIRNETFR